MDGNWFGYPRWFWRGTGMVCKLTLMFVTLSMYAGDPIYGVTN